MGSIMPITTRTQIGLALCTVLKVCYCVTVSSSNRAGSCGAGCFDFVGFRQLLSKECRAKLVQMRIGALTSEKEGVQK